MESNEVVNTKINPILIVVGIILIVVSALIGWYVGGNKDNRPLEKEEVKTEEKVEGKPTYEVKLIDENNEYYTDISLKDEEKIKDFIAFTDRFTDNVMRSTFLESGYLVDDYKLVYILVNLLGDEGGVYYFSTEFLNSEIKKVFSIGIDSFDFMSGSYWLDARGVTYVCNKDACFVSFGAGGGTGSPYYETKIVSSRQDGDNTIYTIKEYYDDVICDADHPSCISEIYTTKDGTLLCKDSNCPEDIVGTYGDKLNTYEMTFDKDNRYVSSKKVS